MRRLRAAWAEALAIVTQREERRMGGSRNHKDVRSRAEESCAKGREQLLAFIRAALEHPDTKSWTCNASRDVIVINLNPAQKW